MKASDILNFWFKEIKPSLWWVKDADFDKLISDRFSTVHHQVCSGEMWAWRESVQGRLAEIIVIDQFSRNIYRDSPKAFAWDSMALVLAQEVLRQGMDKTLSLSERSFLYLPYMHSESLKVHKQAVGLFSAPGLENNLDFELKHKVIIERFGRYPHRNEILGRETTEEERLFLQQPGSSF